MIIVYCNAQANVFGQRKFSATRKADDFGIKLLLCPDFTFSPFTSDPTDSKRIISVTGALGNLE